MASKQSISDYVSSPSDELRLRVMKLKTKLPRPWMGDFISMFPKYNTVKEGNRVKNVVILRMLDEDIITDLETFVNTKKK